MNRDSTCPNAPDSSSPTHPDRPSPEPRPARWSIDEQLERLIGENIRVAAEAFIPGRTMALGARMIRTVDLVLPDGTLTEKTPVFFEGRLVEMARAIGVVHVLLDSPDAEQASTEGRLLYRGREAVILRGPAVVRLGIPFSIEKLPRSSNNYWQDIHLPQAQFFLNLSSEGSGQ